MAIVYHIHQGENYIILNEEQYRKFDDERYDRSLKDVFVDKWGVDASADDLRIFPIEG